MPSFYTQGTFYSTLLGPLGFRPSFFERVEAMDKEEKDPEQSFGNLMLKALDDVNTLQMKPYQLTEKLVTDPSSVDIHDITLASAQATLSLSITKELFERAIRAYKEIISIR